MVLTNDELGLRQTTASIELNELLTGYWLEHVADCPALYSEQCDCGLIVWFTGKTKVVGVDSALNREVHIKQ